MEMEHFHLTVLSHYKLHLNSSRRSTSPSLRTEILLRNLLKRLEDVLNSGDERRQIDPINDDQTLVELIPSTAPIALVHTPEGNIQSPTFLQRISSIFTPSQHRVYPQKNNNLKKSEREIDLFIHRAGPLHLEPRYLDAVTERMLTLEC